MNKTKEKIINESLTLFSREGFESVSISRITSAVGIAKSSLYSHFKTKQEILDAVFELYRETRNALVIEPETIEQMLNTLSVEQFWLSIQRIYRSQWESIALSRVGRFLVIEQYRNKEAMEVVRQESETLLNMCESLLKRQHQLNKIECPDPASAAVEYVYAIRGMMMEMDILMAHSENYSQTENKINNFIIRFASRLTRQNTGEILCHQSEAK